MVGIHNAMNIQIAITNWGGGSMGGVIIILTRGIGKPTSSWSVGEACCSTVGVPVPKILLLDIWVCTVATFLQQIY